MKMRRWFLVLGVVVALLTFVTMVGAKEEDAASSRPEDQAAAIFKRMADFLKKSKQYTVTVDSEYDVVQESGQKIEFGEMRKMSVVRPDRLRVDVESRDGRKGTLVFNGKDVIIYNAKDNVFSSEFKPGDLDQLFDHLKDELEISLPLGQVFSESLGKAKTKKVRSLVYVGKASIGGVPCDHVAGTTEKVDFQVFIAQGDRPLPYRILISYRKQEGKPQFRAQLSEWNLSANIPESSFVFSPPEGTERIPFLGQLRAAEKQRAEKHRVKK